ncbi:HFL227Cp [Eremothecium sinecaudum]|uniref:Histone-lysine N-methyltransferase, H3 lysine-79 specific n=1 Tax=Eremothecium sinecaudum TaxID=45286 RepID=A0A0X8HUA6_9SACH|nr:HFL227Cp [Eremothecium sinecaudum]AMD21629.1 HFL227Cp [Eremothecium sinecaudum]
MQSSSDSPEPYSNGDMSNTGLASKNVPNTTNTSKKRKPNRMLLQLLEDSNKYDMRSEYSLPETWLRRRQKVIHEEDGVNGVEEHSNGLTTKKGLVKEKHIPKPLASEAAKLKSKKNILTGIKVQGVSVKHNKSTKEVGARNEGKVRKKKSTDLSPMKSETQSIRQVSQSSEAIEKHKVKPEFFVNLHNNVQLSYDFFDFDNMQDSFEGSITSAVLLSSKDSDPNNRVRLHSLLYPEHFEEYSIPPTSSSTDSFNPMVEIGKLIEYAVNIYFPAAFRKKGRLIVKSLYSACESRSKDKFVGSLNKYNELIKTIPRSEIVSHLKSLKVIPLSFIHELLQLIYSRCVLPKVHSLKEYQGFSNYVYGELLPSFLSTAYKQCEMKPDHIFMDLGSGVGNCVMQASIEYGCKLSFGCEIMKNASDLAEKQLHELRQRCKLWGIAYKPIEFSLRKSFIDNPEVDKLLPICDVILINNFIFDTKLNLQVENLIQVLKPGSKIITLKSLRPSGYTIRFDNVDNILNRLKVEKFTMPEDSVSWTHRGGTEYYISTVQSNIDESIFHSYAKGRIRDTKRIKYTR